MLDPGRSDRWRTSEQGGKTFYAEQATRGPGFASFDKLQEVGFSPYLSFYSHLNVLLMFRLNEAVRGRLIDPKTWDRIDRIFESKMEQPVTAPRPFRGCLGVVCLTCALIGCLVCIGPGMAVDCGFTK